MESLKKHWAMILVLATLLVVVGWWFGENVYPTRYLYIPTARLTGSMYPAGPLDASDVGANLKADVSGELEGIARIDRLTGVMEHATAQGWRKLPRDSEHSLAAVN
jgi:hypothetical protein